MKIAVRLTNWIGDVVMNIPALETVRHHFPDAEITAIARPRVGEVLHFRKDLVDRILSFDDRTEAVNLVDLVRFGHSLRSEKFDLAITLSYHFKGAALLFFAGVPVRVGFSDWDTRIWLNRSIPRSSLPKANRHQSENFLDLLEYAAGLKPLKRQPPKLHVTADYQNSVIEKFLGHQSEPLFIVHAGAAFGTAKRWLPERYAEVCLNYLGKGPGRILLLGVPEEAELNREIELAVASDRLLNLCSQTSLSESIGLISAADVFLSGDSGLMHIAASLNVPQVAIFGPTDPSASFPYNTQSKVLHHPVPCGPCKNRHCPLDHACMKGISTRVVVEALEHSMDKVRS